MHAAERAIRGKRGALAGDDARHGAAGQKERPPRVKAFELRLVARELRSALEMLEPRLEDEVDARARREVRLVVGELMARWLQCAEVGDPMILRVSVLADRVRLDVSASGSVRSADFWTELCDAPGLGLGRVVRLERRAGADAGAYVELPRHSGSLQDAALEAAPPRE
jgi:hypothetical protein